MTTPHIHDLAAKLAENWDCILWAYAGGLPMGFSQSTAESVRILQAVGILDVDLKVSEDFKAAVSAVANGRDIGELGGGDLLNVAHAYAGHESGDTSE